MQDLIDSTSETISTLLDAPVSLRQLAVRLYGDANRVGLLADVRARRYEHVSHAALHDLRRRLGLPYDVRHIVDVPADHDADLHLRPNGNGSLHTYTVPDNAEVVVVPAGARIVQPKTPSKPTKKRERIEVNRYIERGFTHAEIIEIVRAVFDEGNVPSWIWNHPGMADVIDTQLTLLRARAARNDPARIVHLVDAWLAEDAGTDPGEVAAVLARLE